MGWVRGGYVSNTELWERHRTPPQDACKKFRKGGGFGGTIQAFVPPEKLDEYIKTLEHVYGEGTCHKLFIRIKGSVKLNL